MGKSTKKPESRAERVSRIIADAHKVVGSSGPVQIVDRDAYNEFTELCTHPIFHEQREYNCSDGKVVLISKLTHQLKKDIEHLPKAEQKKILELREQYNSLLCKRNAKLKQAYSKQVRHSDGEAITASVFSQRAPQMIELFGRMFSVDEVHAVCLEEWHIPVKKEAVANFRTSNWKEIEKRIEEHKRTYTDIRLGHKRSRLEELSWLYMTRKTLYNTTRKADDHRLLLQTIAQIRQEVEGDSLRIEGGFNINLELSVQEHIEKELYRALPLKEIVLARIAARTGASTVTLVNELNRSYYGRFLQKPAEDIAFEELPAYPSAQNYDFDLIRQVQQQPAPPKESTVLPAADTQKALSVKDRLAMLIQQKAESVNYTANDLESKLGTRTSKGGSF